MKYAAALMLLLLLGACGDDVCPSELGDSAEWIARSGEEDECSDLAAELNHRIVVLEFEVEEQGDQCVASLSEITDGVSVDVHCDVSPSGAADCEARVRTAGLDCALLLLLR